MSTKKAAKQAAQKKPRKRRAADTAKVEAPEQSAPSFEAHTATAPDVETSAESHNDGEWNAYGFSGAAPPPDADPTPAVGKPPETPPAAPESQGRPIKSNPGPNEPDEEMDRHY